MTSRMDGAIKAQQFHCSKQIYTPHRATINMFTSQFLFGVVRICLFGINNCLVLRLNYLYLCTVRLFVLHLVSDTAISLVFFRVVYSIVPPSVCVFWKSWGFFFHFLISLANANGTSEMYLSCSINCLICQIGYYTQRTRSTMNWTIKQLHKIRIFCW